MPTIKDVTIPANLVAEYEDAKRCYRHAADQSLSFYQEYVDIVGRYHDIKDADEAGPFWRRECEPREKQHAEAEGAADNARRRLIRSEIAILNVIAAACGVPSTPIPKKEP